MSDNLDKEKTSIETPEKVNSQTDQTDTKEKRHFEQMEGARKEVERKENMLIELYSQKAIQEGGANALYELGQNDPKLAEKVAKNIGYPSVKDALASVEEDFDTLYKKRRDQEKHEEALEEVENKLLDIEESLQNNVRSAFDDLVKGRTLTNKEAMKYLKMATLYVIGDKEQNNGINNEIELYSTGISKTRKQDNKPTMTKMKLDNMGLSLQDQKRLYPELF